jgi:hypothetical protein
VEYWAGIWTVIRLYIQVEFAGENDDFSHKEILRRIGRLYEQNAPWKDGVGGGLA